MSRPCGEREGAAGGRWQAGDDAGRSVGADADVVARRVIVAGDEGAPAIVACDLGAADASGAPPHDLGVVPAHAAVAAVAPVVVAWPLG